MSRLSGFFLHFAFVFKHVHTARIFPLLYIYMFCKLYIYVLRNYSVHITIHMFPDLRILHMEE